jgi:type I restriction enzyme S subunit
MGMPFPSLEEQQKIVAQVEASTGFFNTAITRLEREIELLREYRTRLVADVVTGKLDVREAARNLPDIGNDLPESNELADLSDESVDEEIAV